MEAALDIGIVASPGELASNFDLDEQEAVQLLTEFVDQGLVRSGEHGRYYPTEAAQNGLEPERTEALVAALADD